MDDVNNMSNGAGGVRLRVLHLKVLRVLEGEVSSAYIIPVKMLLERYHLLANRRGLSIDP